MLPVHRPRAVGGHHGPLVVQLDRLVGAAAGEHRLDGEDGPDLEPQPGARLPDVRHEGIHVHRGADAVTTVVGHDAVRGALRPGRALEGVRDVAEPSAGADLLDACPHGRPARRRELLVIRADRPDGDGHRGITVPAVEDRPAVDRDQVALGQLRRGGRDAVHDLLVDRRTDRGGEAEVALERRHGAGIPDRGLGDGVEVGGAQTGPHRLGHARECVGHDETRRPHGLDLAGRLDLHATPPHPRGETAEPLTERPGTREHVT